MKAWLIQIDAWNGVAPVAVRMASHDDDRLCHLDGQTWWPVIEKLPTLRYDFFDGGFDAASITSPSGSFDASIEAIPALPALAIHDARIRIWGGELGADFAAFTLTFDGRVKQQPGASDGTASISFGADDSWLDQPLLKTYAGTGGAEGGVDLEGQIKPLALGAPRFVPGTLVDAVDYIYQLSAYGPLHAVETSFERLNRFGASVGDATNFASLKAATIDRGKYATCLAAGFVRFAAPPEGMLSFHLQGDAQGGWSRLPGDLCRRVAALAGAADRVAGADVAALNASRPWPLSIFVSAQTTARDLIQRIAMSVNAVAYVDWLGVLRLAAIGIGAATMTVAADGSSLPPVAEVKQVETSTPYWKIAQGAAVTWQVHGLNDIAFNAPLNPRGPYDPAETYREGDMVTLPNGSQWLFVGVAPVSGDVPSDASANWFRLSEAITAANVTYDDGTTVEALKPATPNANQGGTIGIDIEIPEIPGIPAPPGLLRNDLLSLAADGVLQYQPYPDNADIKVALGQVAVPDVAGQLVLQPDGTLQFETADGVVAVLGRIRLPDIGAASDASRRTLESAMDQISATVARVASEANRSRETFRDAGFYVDPASGEVRISAVDQTREQVGEAYIRLSAAESLISLSATRTYVNNAIAIAVLDPSQVPIFEGLEVRITSAEVRLDGADAALALKAEAVEVSDLSARVTTAQESIDALAGQISLKVDSVDFNAVVARVASAEQVIEALGDTASITQALTAVRMLPDATADAQESALRAILAGDAARRYQVASLASARTELTAKINEDGSAQARARDELAVRVGAAEAYALQETQVRASETQAIAIQVSQLSTQFNDSRATFTAQIATLASETEALAARSQALEVGVGENTAAIEEEQAARIAEDGTIRASATEAVTAARGLSGRVDTMLDLVIRELLQGDARSRQLSGALAAARQEITAKINGDVEAVVARVSLLLARMGAAEAAIVIEEIARATQYEAVARQITTLSATIDGANATFTQQIGALVTGALAATLRMDAMQSAIGNNASAIENEASTRADADGRIEAAARQTVAAVRGVDGSAAAAAEQALRALLTGDAAKRDAKGAIAATRQEVTARVTADLEVMVQRINVLLARMGLAEASIALEQFTTATALAAIAKQIETLSASIQGDLGQLSASLETIKQASVDRDSALAAQFETLAAQFDDINAAVTSDRAASVDRDGALAARIDTAEAENEDTRAEVRAVEQASVDRDGALAAQVTDLKVEKDDDVAELAADVQQANQARIDGDEAQAASTEALRAEKNDDVADIRAQANLDRQATVEGITAVAGSVDTLRVEKDGDIGALSAELVEERQARLDDKGAIVADVETLRATVGDHTAELEQQSAVLVDLEGRTAIKFRIAATDPDGTTYIEIERQSGTGQIVLGGNTKILGNIVTPGTITAREIEAAGVTKTVEATNPNAVALSPSTNDIVSLPVVMARPGTIIVMAAYQFVIASGGAWSAIISVGDTVLQSGSNDVDRYASFMRSYEAPAPGTYVVRAKAARTAGSVSINAGGCSLLVLRTYV